MLHVSNLIKTHEDWLTDRVILYAHKKNYTQFSSTLREAWRISICGLSEPLVDLIETAHLGSLSHEAMLQNASEFGVQQGLKHRSRGISVIDFVGLMKLYRNAYLDLVFEKSSPDNQREDLRGLILELFDAMETGLMGVWNATTASDRLKELQARNRALSNEKNKYLTVFESIAEPAILLDSNNNPTHINVAANRLLLGQMRSGAGYYSEIQTAALTDIIEKLLESDGPSIKPIVLNTPHGPRSFDVSVQKMLDVSEKFAGRVIIMQDITDYLKAIDAAREADRAKTQFLNTISHEIRTPINSILGLTRLLKEEMGPEPNEKLLSIQTSGTVLASLVENVLGLSKAESGTLQLVEQDFNLDELCKAVAQVVWLEDTSDQYRFEIRIAPDVPRHLHGDIHKLRQVLLNLLSNARKYADGASVVLHIARETASKPSRACIRFEVVDCGPGIPQEAVETLFEPFVQLVQTKAQKSAGGTGLGLAISHRLVSFLGGCLTHRPNPEGGSIFGFALEMHELTDKEPCQTAGLRILVVEDDPLNATVINGYLNELGNQVVVADSFMQANAALEESDFDIVITDFQLGTHTGLDVARRVTEISGGMGRRIPVVMVTAALPQDKLIILRKSGVSRFLEKPFTKSELGAVLSNAMPVPNMRPEPESVEGAIAADNLRQLFSDLGFERGRAVVARFLNSCPELIGAMNASVASEDYPRVAELTHQLTGAAGIVGASGLVELSKELNRLSKQPDNADGVRQKMLEIEAESLRAANALPLLLPEFSQPGSGVN